MVNKYLAIISFILYSNVFSSPSFSRRIIIVNPESPTHPGENRIQPDGSGITSRTVNDHNIEQGFIRRQQYRRVLCVHCKSTFIFTDENCLAECPHCHRRSTINPRITKVRGTVFFIISLVLLAATLGVIFGTLSRVQSGSKGFIALDVTIGIILLFFFFRAISYYRMKVSSVV